jgi:hypothetical protein
MLPHALAPNGEIRPSGAQMMKLDSLFRRYDATYDVNAQNSISGAIQHRLEALLPPIVIAKRNEYFLASDNVSGLKLPPFAPFGSMLNVDVAK